MTIEIRPVQLGYTLPVAAANRREELRSLLETLRPRERQIVDCCAAGMLNKEIAKQLGCSIRTIEGDRAKIFAKLNVENPTALGVLYGEFRTLTLLSGAEVAPR